MTLPAWNETEQRLRAIGATASAPECHGVLCGLLSMDASEPRASWLAETVGDEEPGGEIDALYDATRAAIDDPEFGLELLLPGDEEADLDTRTRALADWASGYIFGVACAGRVPEDLPGEVGEFVRDAAEIAALSPGDEGEGDEADYAEVVEYLRAGAMLARTECRAATRAGASHTSGESGESGESDESGE